MPLIRETIITTLTPKGDPYIAPLGIIEDGANWVIAPFKPSTTLENLRHNGHAVVNYVDDVRIFAGCLTGRKDWPTQEAEKIDGVYLEAALTHLELEVDHIEEDEIRPRFSCKVVHEVTHAPFQGFNRAQAAVVEAAILASRLKMLPHDKVIDELKYLTIAVEKTAGDRELEAWGWVKEKIDDYLGEA